MPPVLHELCKVTYTVNDLHRRLRLMQASLEAVLYDQPEQMRVVPVATRRARAITQEGNEADATVLMALDERIWDGFTAATLVSKMQLLLEASTKLPVMTLYTPVAFTDKQLAPLAEWARREVTPGLMFELRVDPAVVGGCAFVYKDVHFDWSLRRHLRAKRGMVTSLLNAYE